MEDFTNICVKPGHKSDIDWKIEKTLKKKKEIDLVDYKRKLFLTLKRDLWEIFRQEN